MSCKNVNGTVYIILGMILTLYSVSAFSQVPDAVILKADSGKVSLNASGLKSAPKNLFSKVKSASDSALNKSASVLANSYKTVADSSTSKLKSIMKMPQLSIALIRMCNISQIQADPVL